MRRYWKAPPRKPSSVDSIKIYEDHEVGTTQKVAQKVAVLDVPTSDEEVMRPRLQGTLIGEENTQAQPSRDRDLKDTSEVAESATSTFQRASADGKLTVLNPKTRMSAETVPDVAGPGDPPLVLSSKTAANALVVDQKLVRPARSPIVEADYASLSNPSLRSVSGTDMGHEIVSLDLSITPSEGKVLATDDPDMGIALLAGILCNQWVDVQRSL